MIYIKNKDEGEGFPAVKNDMLQRTKQIEWGRKEKEVTIFSALFSSRISSTCPP